MDAARIASVQRAFEHEFARHERAAVPEGFPVLPEVPVGRYTRPDFYEAERRHLWTKAWLIAGHVDELPEIGSFKLWERAGWPVVLVRGKDRRIRAFFNSCRHRGGGLVREACGKARVLACKFHAWTYNLEGRLVFVPDEHEFPQLDKASHGLLPLRCETWGNLIFVNRDPHAPPLLEALGKIVPGLAHFDFEQRRVAAIVEYDLPCNWKVVVDAFQESYHINATHPATVAPVLDSRGSVIELWPGGHSVLTVPRRRDGGGKQDFILDAGSRSEDPRHVITRESNISFTIYPNIIGTAAEYQFPMLCFWPTSLNTTHVDILITEPANCPEMDPAQGRAIIEQFGVVMQEDMGNVSALQKSIEAGALSHIRLGYHERRIYQFHEQLDRDLGEHVPPDLRLPPVLAPFLDR
ncbi:MAG TPA: SRPBCC family protein [Nevskiaceae bacterium]|nr:SRPBCC family protein [Nevskiaceae bacterium]